MTLKETLKKYLEEYVADRNEHGRHDYKAVMVDWENYGKSQTYLKVIETNKNSKHYVEQNYGYIDNQTDKYFPSKYGDIRWEHKRLNKREEE